MKRNIGTYTNRIIYVVGTIICLWAYNVMAQTNSNDNIKQAATELNRSIIWSEQPTNGIRAGIYVERFNSSNGMPSAYPIEQVPVELPLTSTLTVRFMPAFVCVSTNHMLMFLAPEESWKVDLLSAKGESVPKTSLGKRWGKTMVFKDWDPQKSGFIAMIFNNSFQDFPEILSKDIHISDLFEVKSAGDYTLKMTFCGMVATNNQFLPTYFPPVVIRIKVNN